VSHRALASPATSLTLEPLHLACRAELLERASKPFRASAVAESKRPAESGWRGLREVPFDEASERNEFRSQAEKRRMADRNGSGPERKQWARRLRSFAGRISSTCRTPASAAARPNLSHSTIHSPSL